MSISLTNSPALARSSSKSLFAWGCAGLVICALAAACLLAGFFGIALPSLQAQLPSLASSLSQTIDADGVDAAVTRYRSLARQGFAGFKESENEMNDLGYRLLGRGQTAAAIKIFQLNTEAHPTSVNTFDSLGEAEAAAGDVPAAIASYGNALRIQPTFRSSAIAYARLTGIPRKPYLPLVLLHIVCGLGAIVFGFGALAVRKGGRWHRLTGTAFFIAMLLMAGVGGCLAIARGEHENILGASFTLYLVLTAWLAARRRDMKVDALNVAGLVVAWLVVVAAIVFGFNAADQQASLVPFISFGVTALIATLTDLRVIVAGGITGSARIARHLWRMCAALFIAVASFFLGQAQLVPQALRDHNLEAVPPILVILALIYWLLRNYYLAWRSRHGPSLTGSQVQA